MGLGGDSYTSYIVNDWPVATGRVFTKEEEDGAAKIVILGHDTAEDLFPNGDAIGKEVEVSGISATVVGTLENMKA